MKYEFESKLDYYKADLKIYKCNYKKNKECKKNNCRYIDKNRECKHTTDWNCAKRTPSNYIKRIINIIGDLIKNE